MKTTENFTSTGLVYGNLWGGGQGAYSAKNLEAKTKKELMEKAVKGLDGSLDGGMGFDNLIGALLLVMKTTTVIIKGKKFINEEFEEEFIGNLTEEQQDFLNETHF